MTDWKETDIWSELFSKSVRAGREPETERIIASLVLCMPRIQTVLKGSHTSPTDFTLHDADHGFRVAQWMSRVCYPKTLCDLSSYELSLLILSAYLHDVGMTPAQQKVLKHYHYLLTGNQKLLTEDEQTDLERWIDNEGLIPSAIPLCTGLPAPADLSRASELITHYCRYKHNDWSELWIRSNLFDIDNQLYSGFIDDLILLCKSHHCGYAELIGREFEPRQIPPLGRIVHLRYLACLLRVSDILDIDPERTPDVVLRNRHISPQSVIYWTKDHFVTVLKSDGRIVFSAQPSDAKTHRALEVSAAAIEEELRLCYRLSLELPFQHISSIPGLTLPHRWDLEPNIHCSISEKPNTYLYIKGGFRPNTDRLLELLGGINLYKDSKAAVRELIQNAFDAVREQIAYERLQKPSPTDSSLESQLGMLHFVSLRLEIDQDGAYWLSCDDDGAGMTKSIIENHLLVSGNSPRSDISQLRRKCRVSGFKLQRTGVFGIGVLSYFLLADVVVIETKRSGEAGDGDGSGWRFTIEGLDDFGELRYISRERYGTKVRFRLKQDKQNIKKWWVELHDYLRELLVYVPCNMKFSSELWPDYDFEMKYGWKECIKDHVDYWLRYLVERHSLTDRTPMQYWPDSKIQAWHSEQSDKKVLADRILSSFRWEPICEGVLPDDLGKFRILAPIFRLQAGLSNLYLEIQKERDCLLLQELAGSDQNHGYWPRVDADIAWFGLSIPEGEQPGYHFHFDGALVQVDLTDEKAGLLAVGRDEVELSESAFKAIDGLGDKVKDAIQTHVDKSIAPEYRGISVSLYGLEWKRGIQLFGKVDWQAYEPKSVWKEVRFPAIHGDELPLRSLKDSSFNLGWKGTAVSVVSSIKITDFRSARDKRFDPLNSPPDRICYLLFKNHFRIVGLWSKCIMTPKHTDLKKRNLGKFPSLWHNLFSVQYTIVRYRFMRARVRRYVNQDHTLSAQIRNSKRYFELTKMMRDIDNPLDWRDKILSDQETAAAWLFYFLDRFRENPDIDEVSVWNDLAQGAGTFLGDLWDVVFQSKRGKRIPESIQIFLQEGSESMLLMFSPEGCDATQDKNIILAKLGDPGNDWRIVFEDRPDNC